MVISIEQFVEIATAGGGLTMDASTMTFNQLRAITAAANTGKAKITLKKVGGLAAFQLKELGALAPGLITFDLTG